VRPVADGSSVTAEDPRRTACEANIIPVVLGGHSEPLMWDAQAARHPGHRRAITVVRDVLPRV